MNRVCDDMMAIDKDVWMKAALVNAPNDRPIVFDSMRFQNEYNHLQMQGFYLVRIDAPLRVRISRLGDRGQEFDPSIDDVHRGEVELENNRFDYQIVNDGFDVAILRAQVDNLMSALTRRSKPI